MAPDLDPDGSFHHCGFSGALFCSEALSAAGIVAIGLEEN
jgi:hypothetical protein